MQLIPDVVLGAMVGLLGAALYACSVVVYRSQADEISPILVSSIKMWVALPFMSVLIFLGFGTDISAIPLTTIGLLAISIIFGAVVGDTLYLVSQERVGVSYAFPIAMSFPIITYFLTIIFLNETLLLSRLSGVVIAVIGIVVISRERGIDENGEVPRFDILGILLAMATALLYAIGTTVLQVGIADIDPITANFVRVSAGSIAFMPMVLVGFGSGMEKPSRRAAKWVIIAGFFGMAIGSLLYTSAVKFAGAAVTSVVSSTAPLFALPISVIYLKEQVSRLAVLGVAATVAGVVLVVLAF